MFGRYVAVSLRVGVVDYTRTEWLVSRQCSRLAQAIAARVRQYTPALQLNELHFNELHP